MAKLTLEEKRRQNLKRQLYGRDSYQEAKSHISTPRTTSVTNLQDTSSTMGETLTENDNYLQKDLTKILILSITAIAIQFALLWALNNHLIKLSGISL